jgi:hypothetical protein
LHDDSIVSEDSPGVGGGELPADGPALSVGANPPSCDLELEPVQVDDSSNRIEVGGGFIAISLRRAAAAPPVPRSLYVDRNFSKHFALLQRFLLLCYRLA